MMLLTSALRQTKASYEVKKKSGKINNLLFMDDLKLFAKYEDQIDTFVSTVKFFQRTSK